MGIAKRNKEERLWITEHLRRMAQKRAQKEELWIKN
jgi:hypothetical protein